MHAAEIFGDQQRRIEPAIGTDDEIRQVLFPWREAIA